MKNAEKRHFCRRVRRTLDMGTRWRHGSPARVQLDRDQAGERHPRKLSIESPDKTINKSRELSVQAKWNLRSMIGDAATPLVRYSSVFSAMDVCYDAGPWENIGNYGTAQLPILLLELFRSDSLINR